MDRGGRPLVAGYGGLLRHHLSVDAERRMHRSSYAFSVRKEMFAFLPAVDVPPALILVHDRSRQRALTTRALVLAEFGAKVHTISLQMSQSACNVSSASGRAGVSPPTVSCG